MLKNQYMTNTGIYCVLMEFLILIPFAMRQIRPMWGLNEQVNVGKNENIYIFNKVNAVHLHLAWIVKFANLVYTLQLRDDLLQHIYRSNSYFSGQNLAKFCPRKKHCPESYQNRV
jgi:hypothetical protein